MLWTDLIDPATLTGYARQSLAEYEASRGTLARWLPNRFVADIVVQFFKGQTGLIDIARFRSYDAELEVGKRQEAPRVTLEIPAVGQTLPVSEYEQLRGRGSGVSPAEAEALRAILNTTDQVVRAVADAAEYLRGIVLSTGRATISQDNFAIDDDFGRSVGHTVTANTLWSTNTNVSRLTYLQTLLDVYNDDNGADPGCIVMSRKVFRELARGDEFQTLLNNGEARPATPDQVASIIEGAGLPPIIQYNRRVSVNGVATKVLDEDQLILLPEPVDPNDELGTQLGNTFWGRTLSSTEGDYGLADSEQPGLVVGVYRNQKPPMSIEVISDAIALPVLANADLSLAATVVS